MNERILVVDDEEDIREVFCAHLRREGLDPEEADGFEAACRSLDRSPFDLVISDISLGGPSGIDLLRELNARGRGCPLVLVTGQPSVDTASEALRLGAFDYLVKPVRKDELLRVVNKALSHKRLADERDRARGHLEAVFRGVQDGIVSVDVSGRVLEANRSAQTICGVERRPGQPFDAQAEQCSLACARVLERTLQTRQAARPGRIECLHARRPEQMVEVSGAPLFGGQDAFLGAALVLRDVSLLHRLETRLGEQPGFHGLIGKSPRMQEIYALLKVLSDTDTGVLITGESGTGKELVAEALHHAGVRAARPLVKVNCSALTESLLESELFGHVKGAFTGALKDKVGRFQLADGGTIFLDEVGEMPLGTQIKLLRVLQEKEFERVGESSTIRVDVRVVAATNSDLKEKIAQREFREDLFYRLKVIELRLPPLRERREDIPLLTAHYLKIFNETFRRDLSGLDQEAMALFMRHPWPGNVRELKHALEHSFILCQGDQITPAHLPAEISEAAGDGRAACRGRDAATPEGQELMDALREAGGKKARAARKLGISRQTLYRRLREFGLEP
jgi:DNA-binding NtrC family response regulator